MRRLVNLSTACSDAAITQQNVHLCRWLPFNRALQLLAFKILVLLHVHLSKRG